MESPQPYLAPPKSSFWQKLGPGGFASLLLALVGGLLLVPLLLQGRRVLRGTEGQLPEAADAILVLGRKLRDDQPTEVFEGRLRLAERLWRDGYAPRIVVAGGCTGGRCSEAEAGCAWLRARGVPETVLFAEDRSQHTLENLWLVRERLRAEGWRTLLLVSDPLHLARAGALARGLSLDVRLQPADCPPTRGSFAWWRRVLTEAFFLHWYRTGMAYSRLIRSERQLARVT